MDPAAEDATMAHLRVVFDQSMIVESEEDKLARLEAEAGKLRMTLKILSFIHLSRVVKYTGLLKNIEACNDPLTSNMRSVVEYAWYKLVEQENAKWHSNYVSDETKTLQLGKALDQVRSKDIEKFWVQKALDEARRQGTVNMVEHVEVQDGGFKEYKDVEMALATLSRESSSTLRIPQIKGGFLGLVNPMGMRYKGFLKVIEGMNGPSITRGVAEAEWKKLVLSLFSTWILSDAALPNKFYTQQKAYSELQAALDQVKGYDNEYSEYRDLVFDPSLYWNGDSANAVRTRDDNRPMKKAAKKAAKATRKPEANRNKSGRIEKRPKKKGIKAGVMVLKTRNTVKSMEAMFSQLGMKESD